MNVVPMITSFFMRFLQQIWMVRLSSSTSALQTSGAGLDILT
jgi:hypothetical protein